jgi:dipeptidyl aminopeptidase/acylaminoacyl peptidase
MSAPERPMAPFGTWRSPLTARMLVSSAVRLGLPWVEDDATWWLEVRPMEAGRYVVVRHDPSSGAADVTPSGFSARTTVHEYGGGSYLIHRGTVFFSNFEDQRLYRLDHGPSGSEAPVAITPDTGGRHRYADGRATADGSALICVRERHEEDAVVNELVTLAADGSTAPRTIAGGRDFYAAPRISSDGTRLAWLSWDLPWMPWDGCELWVADLANDGSLSDERLVAGRDGDESIWQPAWSPTGELHFVSDRTGWWNLYRERDREIQALHPAEAEFGWPHWVFGGSSFAFLDDGRIACIYDTRGTQHVAILDGDTGELIDLDLPYTAIQFPLIVASGQRVVFDGGAPTVPEQVVSLDLGTRSIEVLRESEPLSVDLAYVSVAEEIEFPTEDGLTAHALSYAPANPDVVGPPDERPPLIVMSHGGPTSAVTPAFDAEIQFWTSRGFAVVDVNYGGSTGYGRAYRQRLNGNWGVVDTMDCINAARFLVERGDVDGERLLIRGGSAGGYTTLCALTFHDVFAAGASYFGISDLEPFATGDTHKFESRYEHTLVGPWPEATALYRERSPIHFVDRISCPMILLQGDEDEVVPPAQSEVMAEALRAKGLPYTYLLFEGEQHGFRKADSIVRAAEAELSFYGQILGFEPADRMKRVEIENLGSPT